MNNPRRIGTPASEQEVADANRYCAAYGLNVVMHSGSHVTVRRGSKVVANWWPTTLRTDIGGLKRPRTLMQLCEQVIPTLRGLPVTRPASPHPQAATAAPPTGSARHTPLHAPPVVNDREVVYAEAAPRVIDPRVLKVFCSLLENPEVVQSLGGKLQADDEEGLNDLDDNTDMDALVERAHQLVDMLAMSHPPEEY